MDWKKNTPKNTKNPKADGRMTWRRQQVKKKNSGSRDAMQWEHSWKLLLDSSHLAALPCFWCTGEKCITSQNHSWLMKSGKRRFWKVQDRFKKGIPLTWRFSRSSTDRQIGLIFLWKDFLYIFLTAPWKTAFCFITSVPGREHWGAQQALGLIREYSLNWKKKRIQFAEVWEKVYRGDLMWFAQNS